MSWRSVPRRKKQAPFISGGEASTKKVDPSVRHLVDVEIARRSGKPIPAAPPAAVKPTILPQRARSQVAIARPVPVPASRAPEPSAGLANIRPIAGISIPQKRDFVLSKPPTLRLVSPTDLKVEPAYQRDLTGRSIYLIRKIVIGWDWTKYKPPICAETDDGLFIIDGQHTAIAAASHPEIKQIPVMVVPAAAVERRAEAFVAHNRDRLAMSQFQILHAEAAAGDKNAKTILRLAAGVGAVVPRHAPPKNAVKAGHATAISEFRNILVKDGPEILERILRIGVMAGMAPLARTVTRGLRIICKEPAFAKQAGYPDSRIANALKSMAGIDALAREYAIESGQSPDRACALLIVNACKLPGEAAA